MIYGGTQARILMFDGDVQYYGHIRVISKGFIWIFNVATFWAVSIMSKAYLYLHIWSEQLGNTDSFDTDWLSWGRGRWMGWRQWKCVGHRMWPRLKQPLENPFIIIIFFFLYSWVKVHAHILSQIFQSLTSPHPSSPSISIFLHSFSFNLVKSVMPQGPQ